MTIIVPARLMSTRTAAIIHLDLLIKVAAQADKRMNITPKTAVRAPSKSVLRAENPKPAIIILPNYRNVSI